MNYSDTIILDNENGQAVSLPLITCLLTWNERLEELFPRTGSYWAVGVMRKATKQEIKTVRWGADETYPSRG